MSASLTFFCDRLRTVFSAWHNVEDALANVY